MCNNQNNLAILGYMIEDFKTTNSLTDSDSEIFELYCLYELTKHYNSYPLDELQDAIVDGGQDGGVDGFVIMVNDQIYNSLDEFNSDEVRFNQDTRLRVIFTQSKTSKTFKEDSLDKIFSSIQILFNLNNTELDYSSRFNQALVDKCLLFKSCFKKARAKLSNIEIKYYYVSMADVNSTNKYFNDKIKSIINFTYETLALGENSVSFELIGTNELVLLKQQSHLREKELVFAETPLQVKYSSKQVSYVGLVFLNDYYKFLMDSNGKIQESFFDSNVRHYQGGTDYNNDISNTVEYDYERDFWWLNNGVTIIANNGGIAARELTLINPQIVNGLQTSFTISKSYKHNQEDHRKILVKVIITSDDADIEKIISATNSQNPVSEILLRATDQIQKNIEHFFISKSYYYDRRKGFYLNQGKPSRRIFNIQFTAQAVESILNDRANSAKSTPTKLIKDKKLYSNIFNNNMDYNVYLVCCILQRTANDYIRKIQKDEVFLKNFRYHFTRVLFSVIFNKYRYNSSDISMINIDELDLDTNLNDTKDIMLTIIESYKNENSEESEAIFSKGSKFNTYMLECLDRKFRGNQ